jgi:hypothetical protein
MQQVDETRPGPPIGNPGKPNGRASDSRPRSPHQNPCLPVLDGKQRPGRRARDLLAGRQNHPSRSLVAPGWRIPGAGSFSLVRGAGSPESAFTERASMSASNFCCASRLSAPW